MGPLNQEEPNSFFEVNLPGRVNEANGEDLTFKPFCLPLHFASSVHRIYLLPIISDTGWEVP